MLNHINSFHGYRSYLEIGLGSGKSFDRVVCEKKVGVDPEPVSTASGTIYQMSSNEYFQKNQQSFDCIFIDGLHEHEQVLLDVANSLKSLNEGGLIMVHDCNPPTKKAQQVPREGQRIWTGDVWRAWVELRMRSDIHQVCIEEDYGCGVITKEPQIPIADVSALRITYEMFDQYREDLLNLISWEEYERLYLYG